MHVGLTDVAPQKDGIEIPRVHVQASDAMEYRTHWLVEKWSPDQIDFARAKLLARGITTVQNGVRAVPTGRLDKTVSAALGRPIHEVKLVPVTVEIQDEVPSALLRIILGDNPEDGISEQEGNLLLNVGIQKVEDLLSGGTAPTKWDNANARIGVGDSTTAEAALQTDLQAATNKTWVGMNATYPSRASQTLSWQADHTASNYAWQEVAIDNGATQHFLLNRKVTSLGTKTTGTWTITATIALS